MFGARRTAVRIRSESTRAAMSNVNGRQRRESVGTHIKRSTFSFPFRPLTTVSMILPFLCQLLPSHFDVGPERQIGLRFLRPLDLDGDAYNNRHLFKVQGWKVHCGPMCVRLLLNKVLARRPPSRHTPLRPYTHYLEASIYTQPR